jgi:outer membrane protein
MNMIRTLIPALVCMVVAVPATADDLWTVYQAALRSDPQITEALATRNAQREARPQAIADLLPNIGFGMTRTDQTSEGTQIGLDGDGNINLTDFSSERESQNQTLSLNQTLFRWDRWVALKQSDLQLARAEINYEAARQQLIVRVAERYFDLLAAQDNLAFAEANKEAISRQLDQSRRRFEVGLIAITDVQEAQAGYDTAVADEIAASRRVASAREQLREITGEYYESLAGPSSELPLLEPEPADENAWVRRALEDNLTLNAQRTTTELAHGEISRARSGYMPTLDLTASRGRQDNTGATPFDTSDTDFRSVQLRLNVPLFASGATRSRVRQAAYEHEASKSVLERQARATERTARDAYLGVVSDISRVRALRQALASNETALQATEAGFEVGTRTTVDVLNSRSAAFRARNELARSRYDYLLNTLRLREATGSLSEADVRQVNDLLNR